MSRPASLPPLPVALPLGLCVVIFAVYLYGAFGATWFAAYACALAIALVLARWNWTRAIEAGVPPELVWDPRRSRSVQLHCSTGRALNLCRCAAYEVLEEPVVEQEDGGLTITGLLPDRGLFAPTRMPPTLIVRARERNGTTLLTVRRGLRAAPLASDFGWREITAIVDAVERYDPSAHETDPTALEP